MSDSRNNKPIVQVHAAHYKIKGAKYGKLFVPITEKKTEDDTSTPPNTPQPASPIRDVVSAPAPTLNRITKHK